MVCFADTDVLSFVEVVPFGVVVVVVVVVVIVVVVVVVVDVVVMYTLNVLGWFDSGAMLSCVDLPLDYTMLG